MKEGSKAWVFRNMISRLLIGSLSIGAGIYFAAKLFQHDQSSKHAQSRQEAALQPAQHLVRYSSE